MQEIRRIIAAHDQWKREGRKMVLLSIAYSEDPSFKRWGHRLLLEASGAWVSAFGKGQLAAGHEALTLLFSSSENRHLSFDRNEFASLANAVGVMGAGVFLAQPLGKAAENPVEQLRQLVEASQPKVLCRILDSAKREEWGYSEAFGLSEEPQTALFQVPAILEKIAEVQQQRRNKYLEIPEKGQMVVMEYLRPQNSVILVGNNYDLFMMARVTEQLGWRRFVVGQRSRLLPALLAVTDGVLDPNNKEAWPVGPHTGLLQVTHDYANDLALLPELLQLDIPYYGLLGPRRRLQRLDADLQKQGHAPLAQFPQLHSPVGLDLGAETHEEIALAALAEMMTILRSGSGDHLIQGEGPIH